MTPEEIRADKAKMVKRYIKPLIYNLNPIYIDAEFVHSPSGKEYVVLSRQDDDIQPIKVTDLSKGQIAVTVIERVARGEAL